MGSYDENTKMDGEYVLNVTVIYGGFLPYEVIRVKLRYNAEYPKCRNLNRDKALCLYFEKKEGIFDPKEQFKILYFASETGFYNIFLAIKR